MKKIGIITLNGNYNFGNKLQNYALLRYIQNSFNDVEVFTLWREDYKTNIIKECVKRFLYMKKYKRMDIFKKFNILLNIKPLTFNDEYDYYIIGSDQVWNMQYNNNSFDKYFALFSPKEKNISYAASIGVDHINDDIKDKFVQGLNNIDHISVREDKAKQIINECSGREDVSVLIDPTLLLTANDWELIMQKPKKMNNQKFILNYFLGELSDDKKNIINTLASKKGYKIINILDENDPFYMSGPKEFLWLEKNAELICTDSFHSCVFAFIFNRPFIVFDRIENNVPNMNSRIETLLKIFRLKNRKFNGVSINNDNIICDYSESYKILDHKKDETLNFFKSIIK